MCQFESFVASASAHRCLPRGASPSGPFLPFPALQASFCVIPEPHLSKRNVTNFFVWKMILISSNLLSSSHVNNEKHEVSRNENTFK